MTSTLEKAGKLALICALSALLLGMVNSMTEAVIAGRKSDELENALSFLLEKGSPGAKEALHGSPFLLARYPVEGADAWILELMGNGYGGSMKILASFRKDGSVINVVLMDNAETPGLGKKAENPEYMDKFRGTGGDKTLPLAKGDLKSPDSVSGATITFAGIARALAEGSSYIKTLGDE